MIVYKNAEVYKINLHTFLLDLRIEIYHFHLIKTVSDRMYVMLDSIDLEIYQD